VSAHINGRSCRAVDVTQLELQLSDFVNRREYSRTESTEWRLCRAYGVTIKGSGRKTFICERCVKLFSAVTAAKILAEAPGEHRTGQCTAHGQRGVRQHGIADVQRKLTELGYTGAFLLEVCGWSLLKTQNKVEGRAGNGQFKSDSDMRVDMLVTDARGQLLGIEVNGSKEHRTTKQLKKDLRKDRDTPFPILWLCNSEKSKWNVLIAEAWCHGSVSLPRSLQDQKRASEARAAGRAAARRPAICPTPPAALV
jgi:hypothetical protein